MSCPLPFARAPPYRPSSAGSFGTQPTNPKADHFVSHTDGTTDFNSELWIKPIALFNWLTIAKARGYTAARIVMHGGTKEAYSGVKADPIAPAKCCP